MLGLFEFTARRYFSESTRITVWFQVTKLVHMSVDLVDRPGVWTTPSAKFITLPYLLQAPPLSTQILLKQNSRIARYIICIIYVSGASSAIAVGRPRTPPTTPYPKPTLIIEQRNIESNRPALQANEQLLPQKPTSEFCPQ